MKDFKYPISVTPCRYVTVLGGRSQALADDQVGLHIEALRQNTELTSDDRVLLDAREVRREEPPKPLFVRDTFQIEPLREVRSSRLLSISHNGEAILPPNALKRLDRGDEILLNSAAERIPEGWIIKRINEQMRD